MRIITASSLKNHYRQFYWEAIKARKISFGVQSRKLFQTNSKNWIESKIFASEAELNPCFFCSFEWRKTNTAVLSKSDFQNLGLRPRYFIGLIKKHYSFRMPFAELTNFLIQFLAFTNTAFCYSDKNKSKLLKKIYIYGKIEVN